MKRVLKALFAFCFVITNYVLLFIATLIGVFVCLWNSIKEKSFAIFSVLPGVVFGPWENEFQGSADSKMPILRTNLFKTTKYKNRVYFRTGFHWLIYYVKNME